MPKFSSKDIKPTPFSIASQFTGPPFSVSLESAGIRNLLMREMGIPGVPKADEVPAVPPGKKPARRAKAKKGASKTKKK